MTCRELAELLMEFLEGNLDDEQAEHLRKHLEMCPPCFHYYESYQITIRVSRQVRRRSLPDSLWQKLHACLESERRDAPESDESR